MKQISSIVTAILAPIRLLFIIYMDYYYAWPYLAAYFGYFGDILFYLSVIVEVVGVIVFFFIRQAALRKGRRVPAGVVTLLFVSFIGGILTLAMPDNKIVKGKRITPSTSGTSQPESEDEKIALLQKYKRLYDEGVITEEEFNKKKSDLMR